MVINSGALRGAALFMHKIFLSNSLTYDEWIAEEVKKAEEDYAKQKRTVSDI